MNNFSGARNTERKELWGRRHGECPSHDSLVCAGYLKGPLRHSPRVTPLSERCLPSQQRVWAVCLGQKDSGALNRLGGTALGSLPGLELGILPIRVCCPLLTWSCSPSRSLCNLLPLEKIRSLDGIFSLLFGHFIHFQ